MSNKAKPVSQVWDELVSLLDDIMQRKSIPAPKWMTAYTDVYNLCLITPRRKEFRGPAGKDPARQPANELYSKLTDYLRKSVKSMELLMESIEDRDTLVRTYVQEWNKFALCASQIDHLLDYMNRFWVPKMREFNHKDVYPIQALVLLAWRDYVFNALCRRITEQLMQLIERERDGDSTIDTSIISTVAGCYIALGAKASGSSADLSLYNNEFARPYESNTRRYYTHEAAEQLSILGVSKYLALVDKRLKEEEKRSEDYLHASTRQSVRNILMDTLVRTHKEALCAEFPQMLEQDRKEDLALLYKFIAEVSGSNGVSVLAPVLGQYILEVGHKSLSTVRPPNVDPVQFVRILLDVFIRFDELVSNRCKNDPKLRDVFRNSCRELVNNNCVTKFDKKLTPESLAKYADQLLKKGGLIKQSMEDTERDINALVGLYELLDDKDVFQTVHNTLLAKRLVTKMCVSTDIENTIVQRIAKISGMEGVMKMTRMLKDDANSVDIGEEFHKSSHYPSNKGLFKKTKGPSCDFQPMILTKGSWPLQPYDNFKLPADLMVYESAFLAFYKEKNPRQKLKWAYNMSRGELIASCFTPPAGQPASCVYTLLASSYQIVILVLFNDADIISLKEITELTGIDMDHAKSVVLLFARHKILKCSSPLNAIDASSKFSINRAFSSKRLKLNLTGSPGAANKAAAAAAAAKKAGIQKPQGTPAEGEGSTPGGTTTTTTTPDTPTPKPQGIDEDGFVSGMSEEEMRENRKFVVQSVIVRIMKARKTITHNMLISETINQVSSRFKPNVPMIKACIEELIEHQYLTRDMKDPDTYHYIG